MKSFIYKGLVLAIGLMLIGSSCSNSLLKETDLQTSESWSNSRSIVPVGTAASVALRLGASSAETDYYIQNPGSYPVCSENVDWLQIWPELISDQQMQQANDRFKTNLWTEEQVLKDAPGTYSSDPVNGNLSYIVRRIQKVERTGFSVKELIVYREPMLDGFLPGPFSDSRLIAGQDIDALRQLFQKAYAQKLTKFPNYSVIGLIYQFSNLDSAAKTFVKDKLDGLCVEVNSHDYASKAEDEDAANAAQWALANGKQFGITSGAGKRFDTEFVGMYQKIFGWMAAKGVSKSNPNIRYILHHNAMTLEQTLPETTTASVTNNCKWLIQQVKTIDYTPPAGYVEAAGENGTKTFTQPVDVAYGANGVFAFKKNVTGTVTFNNVTFGDPLPGAVKRGYSKPTSGGTSFVADYTVTSDWGSGGSINVTIVNNGPSAVNGWTFVFDLPANQSIANSWNGTFSNSGQRVSVRNVDWNAAIGANGGSVSIGFNVNFNGNHSQPTNATLNGQACTVK